MAAEDEAAAIAADRVQPASLLDKVRNPGNTALPVHSHVRACKIALAFQIADDILDQSEIPIVARQYWGIPVETRAMFVDSLRLEGAKAHAYALAAEAAAILAVFGD